MCKTLNPFPRSQDINALGCWSGRPPKNSHHWRHTDETQQSTIWHNAPYLGHGSQCHSLIIIGVHKYCFISCSSKMAHYTNFLLRNSKNSIPRTSVCIVQTLYCYLYGIKPEEEWGERTPCLCMAVQRSLDVDLNTVPHRESVCAVFWCETLVELCFAMMLVALWLSSSVE